MNAMFERLRANIKRVFSAVAVSTLILSTSGGAAFAYAYPSTHAQNVANGWGHVEVVSASFDEMTLRFVAGTQFAPAFVSCFEYRSDGDTSQALATANPNPAVADRYPHICVSGAQVSSELTIPAQDYIEVRSTFGPESDERFDWTQFDTVADTEKPVIVLASGTQDGTTLNGTVESEITDDTEYTVFWTADDAGVVFGDTTAEDTTITVPEYGTFTFTLTVTDEDGNEETTSFDVNFDAPVTTPDPGENIGDVDETASAQQTTAAVTPASILTRPATTIVYSYGTTTIGNADDVPAEEADENDDADKKSTGKEEGDVEADEDQTNFSWWWLLIILGLIGLAYYYQRRRNPQS